VANRGRAGVHLNKGRKVSRKIKKREKRSSYKQAGAEGKSEGDDGQHIGIFVAGAEERRREERKKADI